MADGSLPPPGDPLADGTRWVRSAQVLERLLPHGILLLALDGDEPILVTGPGPDLWHVLDEPRTLAELAGLLGARYDADADVVARDLAPVLERLEASRLVTTVA
ncbi:MAG: PqqD family protein [Acidimicrobiales bacterium]|nr:PqqD family protein [Acidimicrobiales bacterium]